MPKATPNIPMLNLRDEYQAHKADINAAINRVLESGIFIGGPEVEACEKDLASFLGIKHVVSLNSGTDALVIALRSLGIGQGDEVITSPFSFFATAEAISLVGATPVFADIDPRTFNIDPSEVSKKITEKTKAILPVHLFGLPADLKPLLELAKKYGLYMIEDCAQSFGSLYEKRMTGGFADFGAYSFFPSKNLGCYGDGGLVATNSDDLAQHARKLASHGSKVKYQNDEIGYNSRLDSIQAAILRVKLKFVLDNIQRRQAVARTYTNGLSGVSDLVLPGLDGGHTFNQFTVRTQARDRLKAHLDELGVSSSIYYPVTLNKLKPYLGQNAKMPLAERAAKEVLSLPICPYMTPEVMQRVIAGIAQFRPA